MSSTLYVPSTVVCRKTVPRSSPLLVPSIFYLSSDLYYLMQPRKTIYVNGANFRMYSVVVMDGYICDTFFNNSVVLGFTIPPQIQTAGSYLVQVQNINYEPNGGLPNTGYLSSNAVSFTVEPPIVG